jgi:PEP-CTERM motif-containing protein
VLLVTTRNANKRNFVMKTFRSLMAVSMLAIGMSALVMPSTAVAAWDQAWVENGIGSFDSIGMQWVSGGTLATPTMTLDSGASNWSEINNSQSAYASFDSTTEVFFSTHLVTQPGSFAFYAWLGDKLVDSALVDSTFAGPPQFIASSPFAAGAPDRAQFVSSIPEPESYAMMLAGLGLMVLVARRRKLNTAV